MTVIFGSRRSRVSSTEWAHKSCHSGTNASACWQVASSRPGNKTWAAAPFLVQKWQLSVRVKVQAGSCHCGDRLHGVCQEDLQRLKQHWLFNAYRGNLQLPPGCLTPRASLNCQRSPSLLRDFGWVICNEVWVTCPLQPTDKSSYTVSILRGLLCRRGCPSWEYGHLSACLYSECLGKVLQVLFLVCVLSLENVLGQR